MHRSEERDYDSCNDCGAEVHAARDRGFVLDAERVLCFACAMKHGGAYDEAHDVWTKAPDLGDLASEPPR